MANLQRYPLHWPDGWPRMQNPKRSQFSTSLLAAMGGLMKEVKLLGGKNLIVSSNLELRPDGLPYARQRYIDDTGAAAYFNLRGVDKVFACDKWIKTEDNIHSIRKTIEALRGIERWGSSDLMERSLKGFEALPEKAGPSVGGFEPWWVVLGVDRGWSLSQVEKEWKAKSHTAHPHNGGSDAEQLRLNNATTEARVEKGKVT